MWPMPRLLSLGSRYRLQFRGRAFALPCILPCLFGEVLADPITFAFQGTLTELSPEFSDPAVGHPLFFIGEPFKGRFTFESATGFGALAEITIGRGDISADASLDSV